MTLAGWESLSFNFLSLGTGTVVRSLALAAVCAALAWVFRSRSAALRHLIWKGMLYALLLMPVLLVALPPLQRVSGALTVVEVAVLPKAPVSRVTTGVPMPGRTKAGESIRFRWLIAAAAVWLAVSSVLLLRLAIGLARLRRLASRSETASNEQLSELAHSIWLRSGCPARPRIAITRDLPVPVSFGLTEPNILLPAKWEEWDEFTLAAVLTHELGHVRRKDGLTAFLACFATCLFWFHPLSWFLQRRLAALAEEACDEEVLATLDERERYARVLIGFARLQANHAQGTRLASAMVGAPHLKSRIERLFVPRRLSGSQRLWSGTILALLVPLTYLAAASRFEQAPQDPASTVVISDQNYWILANTLTAADEAALSASLQAHPNDLDARSKLLVYYQSHRERDAAIQQLLWFIEHHPGSSLLPPAQMMLIGMKPFDPKAERLSLAWKNAVVQHPQSAAVLFNAAQFLVRFDSKYALALLSKVQKLDPSKAQACQHSIERIYAAAEIEHVVGNPNLMGVYMSPDLSTELDSQLENSKDPALLSRVGSLLVTSTFGSQYRSNLLQRGLELIKTAIALDPANPAWQEALDSAKAEPERQRNAERLNGFGKPLVRIGSAVADANLVKQVPPVYPPSALAAHQQGDVEFTITIGKDGHVTNLELVRGNPVFVQAALQSILARVYHPTLMNGEPVVVLTEATVSFRLPQ